MSKFDPELVVLKLEDFYSLALLTNQLMKPFQLPIFISLLDLYLFLQLLDVGFEIPDDGLVRLFQIESITAFAFSH